MSRQRRTFSVDQKLQIMNEADQLGVTQALRKHNLSHSVFLRWKRRFDTGGPASLKPQYHKIDPQIKALQEENARLKKIIGNQALELEFKTELLKKQKPHQLQSFSNGLELHAVLFIISDHSSAKVPGHQLTALMRMESSLKIRLL